MTICPMTNKKIKCPECGSSLVSICYGIDYTHFYCQNMARDIEKQCKSLGRYCFKTYHWDNLNYPQIIRKDKWIHGGEKEESIEYKE